jgi:uncharacterized membrane protein YtjA (UPF0391 family)
MQGSNLQNCILHSKKLNFALERAGMIWANKGINKLKREVLLMLSWTLIFLVVALIAGALGFTGVAGAAVGIARVLFTIFIILFLATLVFGLIRG